MNEARDLPARARAIRKDRRLTQSEVAEMAGISLRAYQMFETRKSSPQGENLRAILRALEMDEAGEMVAEETREGWTPQVRVFLDMMGAYLSTLDEEAQLRFIGDEARRIFDGHH